MTLSFVMYFLYILLFPFYYTTLLKQNQILIDVDGTYKTMYVAAGPSRYDVG